VDHKEIEYEDVDWIRLAQDMIMWRALVNTVIIPRVLEGVKCLYDLSDCLFLEKDSAPCDLLIPLVTDMCHSCVKPFRFSNI
jgi:hypothetical protein